MHPDVVDDHPGTCPICAMKLEPVRLDSVWSCPVHEVIAANEPGRCRICGRELVHVTVAVSWTCSDRPNGERLEPGPCPDGSAARAKYARRPHGNHNPQHGGQFFMAPDNWHHLEGVYPKAGVFRLYVYDDYSKPLTPAQLERIAGKVTTSKGDMPLTFVRSTNVFEVRLEQAGFPVSIAAQVAFTPGGPSNRFDFTFTAYSREEVRLTANATDSREAVRPKADATYAPRTDAALVQLRDRAQELKAIIDRGAFGELYVPAFAAKDLALAIQAAAPPVRRPAIEAAASRLVRAAWMLDAAGDLGNRADVADAYAHFAAAVAELEAAVGGAPR
jgi:hypothetical protein